MADDHRQDITDRSRLLARIADQLGVPITEFYTSYRSLGPADAPGEEALAVMAMVQAYFAIGDRVTRQRSIQLVRSMARITPVRHSAEAAPSGVAASSTTG
ncbi:hypothetical protein [Methylobacterium sp. WL6]|uniref:hypothetical protein n=1 Tax=Methylobacterium sp. WL6 TaxID=2603901 RepID=UPI0011C95009|nr:hypothetical protein [Methylobacterium sp. WL6]TXN63524.1 hypothetical protein FV230_19945 [Methylobacterium sp. WL6]